MLFHHAKQRSTNKEVQADKELAMPSAIPSTMQSKQCPRLTITTQDLKNGHALKK
jgi:hypothetical protein